MDITLLVTILAAIGGPAGIVALIMVLPQVKKLQADTSAVEANAELSGVEGAATLSNAALAQMAAAVARATAAEGKADALEARLEAIERSFAEYRRHQEADVADQVAWAEERIDQIVQLGVQRTSIPAPPVFSMVGRQARPAG